MPCATHLDKRCQLHHAGATAAAPGCLGNAHLVHARGQQLDDGEVLACALQDLARGPVVKGALHLHMVAAMAPCEAARAWGRSRHAAAAMPACCQPAVQLHACMLAGGAALLTDDDNRHQLGRGRPAGDPMELWPLHACPGRVGVGLARNGPQGVQLGAVGEQGRPGAKGGRRRVCVHLLLPWRWLLPRHGILGWRVALRGGEGRHWHWQGEADVAGHQAVCLCGSPAHPVSTHHQKQHAGTPLSSRLQVHSAHVRARTERHARARMHQLCAQLNAPPLARPGRPARLGGMKAWRGENRRS